MPFTCIYQLNNGSIEISDEVVFIHYVDQSFGKFHNVPVRIAKVFFNGKSAFIYSNAPGFPSTKGQLKEGDRITPETKIAYFSANGEDVPYNRPYAIIRFA